MRQFELEWSQKNEEHIARHQVSRQEVEEAVSSSSAYVLRGPGKGLYVVLGTTDSGRYLKVILRVKATKTAFVITALDMNVADRALYRKKRRG